MKTMNDPAKDAYFEPACYASRIAALISEHQSKDERPDWWQQVVAQLHSQLDKQFPQFEVEFEELTAADVIPPYKGRPDKECPVCGEPEDKPHAPDCEYAVLDSLHLPGMENSRLNAMDWRFNGIEERLGTLETDANPFRLNGMDRRLVALEDWADIRYLPNEAGDYVPHNCIHDLIVEGTADAVADMQEPIERLTARIDDLQSLLLKMALKVEALEQKTPC